MGLPASAGLNSKLGAVANRRVNQPQQPQGARPPQMGGIQWPLGAPIQCLSQPTLSSVFSSLMSLCAMLRLWKYSIVNTSC